MALPISQELELVLRESNDVARRLEQPLTLPELRGTPFERAVQKGLSKKPEHRFRDAHEFLAAFGATAASAAVTGEPPRLHTGRLPSIGGRPEAPDPPQSRGGFFNNLFRGKR